MQKKVVEFNQLLKDTKHYKSLRKREENDENYQRLQVGLIVKEKKGMQEIKVFSFSLTILEFGTARSKI